MIHNQYIINALALLALLIATAAFRRVLELQKANLKLQARIAYLYKQTGIVFEPGLDPTIYELVRARKIIQAIKLYRDLTGKSLRESKDAIDAIARGEVAPKP